MMKPSPKGALESARQVLQTEIEGLKSVLEQIGPSFEKAVELIETAVSINPQSQGRVVVTGMGKSGLVGQKISATLSSTDTPSFFLHPGEAFHGDLGMIRKQDVILALSYSGETEELIRLIPYFKEERHPVISMTAKPDSTLAKHSDAHLSIKIPKEACPLELAPTTSTTAMIAMGDALAIALMNRKHFTPDTFARYHPGGSLGKKLLYRASQVMRSHELPTVIPSTQAIDLVQRISEGGLGMAVVLSETNQKIVGIVTDGDIRRAMQKHGKQFMDLNAGTVMSPNPRTIEPKMKLVDAEALMAANRITSLLVAEDGILKGVLHIHDLQK